LEFGIWNTAVIATPIFFKKVGGSNLI